MTTTAPTTVTMHRHVLSEAVLPGDTIKHGERDITVTAVQPKTTKVWIELGPEQKPLKLDKGHKVWVGRPTETAAAVEDRLAQLVRGQLTAVVKSGQQEVDKINEATNPVSMLSAMEWMGGQAFDVAYAALAQKALDGADSSSQLDPAYDLLAAIAHVRRECERDLMGDYLRGGSTAFSNATDDARRAAASRFAEQWAVDATQWMVDEVEAAPTGK